MTDRFAFDELAFALFAKEFAILINEASSAVSGDGIALQLGPFPDGVIIVGMHILDTDSELFFRIVDHDVRIRTRHKDTLLRSAAKELGRIGTANLNRFVEGDAAFVCFRKHIGEHVFDAGATVGNLCEIILAPVFFIRLERTVVGSNGGDVATFDSFPKSILAFFAFHRRGTDEVSAVFSLVYILGEVEVLWTGFCKDRIPFISGLGYDFHPLCICQMNDVHGGAKTLRPLNRAKICLSLNEFGTTFIMVPCG